VQKKILLTIPFVALLIATTVQADAATKYEHTQTGDFISWQLRSSNAYVAPETVGVQSDLYAKDPTRSHSDYYYLKGSCWDNGTCD
jgi:hypothetical protein